MPPDKSVISEPARRALTPRQAMRFDQYLGSFVEWMARKGKYPDRNEGLAESTVSNNCSRVDQFYRWLWDRHGAFTIDVSHDDTATYVDQMLRGEITKPSGERYSGTHIRKTADALCKLFQYRARRHGDEEWNPDYDIQEDVRQQADPFTKAERQRLREAALEYETIPAYDGVSPEVRDRLYGYLAQKLGTPKSELTPEDWKEFNRCWKIPSLVMTALDAGFRPCEVEAATVDWLQLDANTLRIPRDEAAKERETWTVALTTETADALQEWLDQRAALPKYDDRDPLWLNRQGNPYNSGTLNPLLDDLVELARIKPGSRHLVWYSIRHSTGTYLTNEGSIAQAQEQLRHKSSQTTMRYANPPPEVRQDTLEKL